MTGISDGVGRMTPFVEPIRSILTFEAAIDNILTGVERARLRVGERLPNEGGLAEQLGISKPTLRQALRVLQRSGVLTVKPGKAGGIFLNSEYIPAEALSSNIALEEHSVVEALTARRVVETAITLEAARNATDDDLSEIERTVDLVLRGGISRTQVMRADMMFHRAVARAAHNRILERVLHAALKELAPIRDALRVSAEEARLVDEIHRAQLDAMRSRDDAKLVAVLDRHFRYLEEQFAVTLQKRWDDLFAAGGTGSQSAGLPGKDEP